MRGSELGQSFLPGEFILQTLDGVLFQSHDRNALFFVRQELRLLYISREEEEHEDAPQSCETSLDEEQASEFVRRRSFLEEHSMKPTKTT